MEMVYEKYYRPKVIAVIEKLVLPFGIWEEGWNYASQAINGFSGNKVGHRFTRAFLKKESREEFNHEE